MTKEKREGIPLTRRQFLKVSAGGMGAIAAGSTLSLVGESSGEAKAQSQSLTFTITDAVKEMVTHQPPELNDDANTARCYHWVFKEASVPANAPAPSIFVAEGDEISISVTNDLDEIHEFAVPGINFTTGRIAPGDTFTGVISVPSVSAGTYLYYDTLNAPVNRMMGLHGAFVVMPNPATGTPYNPNDRAGAHPNVQQLFADLGGQPWFPGLSWDEGGRNPEGIPDTPPFRQYIWLLQELSPSLFADVGRYPPGQDFPSSEFVERFINNSFQTSGSINPPDDRGDTPTFFTISGQSGHFAHNTAYLNLFARVGEPGVVRVLNAGLWTHCCHMHANHFYPLKVRTEGLGREEFNMVRDIDPDDVPALQDNHFWVDTYDARPLDIWEAVVPMTRPPDIPNTKGIARPDASDPLPVDPTPIQDFGSTVVDGEKVAGPTPEGVTTWPPIQELHMYVPIIGTKLGELLDRDGNVIVEETPVHHPLSPQCFPMHDHSEPSQTAQGGNYNQGMVAGMFIIGDRNADGRLDANAAAVGDMHIAADGAITFPHPPTRFEDADFGDEAANQRAVFGADANRTIEPADGPKPPFEEF